jgi:hypothetical protein
MYDGGSAHTRQLPADGITACIQYWLVEEDREPTMVFAVEPGFTEPGVDGYHVEDLILVTEHGPEWLTDPADGQELFVIQ